MGADPTKTSLYSNEVIDQVVYANTESGSIANSAGATATISFTSNLTQLARPVGIFSYDGGVTWNDLGNGIGISTTVSYGNVVNTITEAVISGGVTVVNCTFEVITTLGSGPIPVIVKLVLLADTPSPQLGLLPEQGSSPVAYASSDSLLDAAGYRQVIVDGNYESFGTTQIVTIPHNLGYIPDLNIWRYDGSHYFLQGSVWLNSISSVFTAFGYGACLDATNLYLAESGFTGQFYLFREYHP